MEKKRCYCGFSILETLVASVFLGILVVGISQLLKTHVNLLHKNKLLTNAAAVAENLSAIIKTQPFESIFSYDSSTPDPYGGTPPRVDQSSFRPDCYLIALSTSNIKPVLEQMTALVDHAGFDGWRMDVTYMRQDSSDRSQDGSVGDSIAFKVGSLTNNPTKLLDDRDPNVFFMDRNGDGDYYDVVMGTTSSGSYRNFTEVPDTGIKMLTISVFKNGESVGVKHGTILVKGGLTGSEVRSSQSRHKIRILAPKRSPKFFLCQLSNETKAALELPIRRPYPSTWWDQTSSAAGAARVDTNSDAVQVNKKINLDGSALDNGFQLLASRNRLRISGETDSGVAGHLTVYDQFGGPAPSNNQTTDQAVMTIVGNLFHTDYNLNVLRQNLMADGAHTLWSRKRVGTPPNEEYSPYDVRTVYADNGIPRLYDNSITTATTPTLWPAGGKSPIIWFRVSDYFQVDGVSRSVASNINPQVTSIILKDDQNHYEHAYYRNPPHDWQLDFDVQGSSCFIMLIDKDRYPQELSDGTTYNVIYEWGDMAGYKSSFTYTFKTPTQSGMNLDSTLPLMTVEGPSVPFSSPVITRNPTHTVATQVHQNMTYSFASLWFQDLESGIQFKTYKIEICDEPTPSQPLAAFNFTGLSDSRCETIFNKNENMRPSIYSTVEWGRFFMYAKTHARPGIRQIVRFSSADVGKTKYIRVGVKNWKGVASVLGDKNGGNNNPYDPDNPTNPTTGGLSDSNDVWKVHVVP